MTRPVDVPSFTRAESDVAIEKVYGAVGFEAWLHLRAPTPVDNQMVIRMNRDTLYRRWPGARSLVGDRLRR
jgi:hypothetical protein